MIHRINVFLLSLIVAFYPTFVFAVDDDDFWTQRQISIGEGKNDYHKRVYGQYARTKFESSTNLTTGQKENVKALIERSVVVDKPTSSKVGGAMFKRLSAYAKAPGVQMIGVAAVVELLEAIGWVMEDGAYVKYKSETNGFEYKCTYSHATCTWVSTASQAVQQINTANQKVLDPMGNKLLIKEAKLAGDNPNYYAVVTTAILNTSGSEYNKYTDSSPLDRRPKPVEKEKIPLTPQLLGNAMLGDGYSDPVDDSVNNKVNTKDWTSVAETYQHDESGVGNEVAESLDEKAKNANRTPDGKPAPLGDPRYDDKGEISDGDTSKDRKWEEDGDTANGETKPTVDPETGDQTGGQSISLQFPVFCSWAFKMCAWYDDWKKSDKVYKDHMTKTEEHQKDEKSFWDWFRSDDDLPEKEQDDQDQEDKIALQKVEVNWGAQCPQSESFAFELMGQSIDISIINFDYICPFAPIIKPVVIFGASLEAIFILSGIRRNGGGDE